MRSLAESVLYLVADPNRLEVDEITGLGRAGLDVLQLRMKGADTAELTRVGAEWGRACAEAGVLFFVNDDPEAAAASGANGVHLGQDDTAPARVRQRFGASLLIGRSTHTIAQVDEAESMFAAGLIDYYAVGPVHETPTKPGRPALAAGVIEHAAATGVAPWFAIGGLDAANCGDVARRGARRIAVVRAVLAHPDREQAVAWLRDAVARN